MPRKYAYKKRPYRRRRRKNRYTAKRYRGVSAISTPLPDRLKTTLKYVENVTLNPGLGGIMDTNIWRANSLYDPNYTGVGHQPRGFDQFMGLYTRYEVLGSMIKITANNRDNNFAQIISLSLRNDISVPASIQDYQESGNTKWKLLGPETAGGNVKSVMMKINPSKYLGLRSRTASLRGTVGANPSDQAYYHVGVECANTGQDSDPVDVLVEIHYICEFTEPINLSGS